MCACVACVHVCVYVCVFMFQTLSTSSPIYTVLMQGNNQTTQAVQSGDVSRCDTGSVLELVPVRWGNPYLVTLLAKN